MKTRSWILLFSALALICTVLSAVIFLGAESAATAVVYSDGEAVRSIDLSVDGEYRIDCGESWNILTVRDGKISVTAASCASQDCVHHAPADSGAPIVCLPNRLVIRFTDGTTLDAMIG